MDRNNATNWPERKPKKIRHSTEIKDAKVKGLEHINHRNKVIEQRRTGPDCTKFNIKFGFPRSDTCADCDSFLHKMNAKDI